MQTVKRQELVKGSDLGSGVVQDHIKSPMPGTVAKVFVKAGQQVKAGDTLVAVESMKMEYNIKATHDAIVSEVLIKEGQFVEMRQKLVQFK